MRQILLQNAPGFLLQNATVLLQNMAVITKCAFITNCDSTFTICFRSYESNNLKILHS